MHMIRSRFVDNRHADKPDCDRTVLKGSICNVPPVFSGIRISSREGSNVEGDKSTPFTDFVTSSAFLKKLDIFEKI